MNHSFLLIIITRLIVFPGIFMLLFLIYAGSALVVVVTTILLCSLCIMLARIFSFSTFLEFTCQFNVFDFIFYPRRQLLLFQSLLGNKCMLVDYIIENHLPEVQLVITFWEHIKQRPRSTTMIKTNSFLSKFSSYDI